MPVIKPNYAWTPAEELRLEHLRIVEGLTSPEIARRMGRTHRSVESRIRLLGLRMPLARGAAYAALFGVPHTIRDVAEAMGVTPGTARTAKKRLKAAGIKVVPADLSQSRRWAGHVAKRRRAGQ